MVDTYDNFFEMVNSIIDHCKDHQCKISCCDSPQELKIGYVCDISFKEWNISLIKLKTCLVGDDDFSNEIRHLLSTKEGRIKIASYLQLGVPLDKIIIGNLRPFI